MGFPGAPASLSACRRYRREGACRVGHPSRRAAALVDRTRMTNYLLSAIRIEAFRMARTGNFIDCRSVETALDKSERGRAGLALKDPTIRSHIDQLCRQHRLGNARLRRSETRSDSIWGAG
jgi:hypothetical protein